MAVTKAVETVVLMVAQKAVLRAAKKVVHLDEPKV